MSLPTVTHWVSVNAATFAVLEEGLRSVAAPICDGEGRAIAAVNVSTHAGRRSVADIIDDLLEPLLRTAREIEADLHQSAAPSGARRSP